MNDLLDARGCGIAAAVSGQAQRRMRGWAAKYPGLYDKPEFDPALYGTLAQAAAFAGPWYGADQLDAANKTCLWAFGLDWLVDYQAKSEDEVAGLIARVKAVAAAEAGPDDELTAFLAELRDDLPDDPALRAIWRDELHVMLDGMALEWRWKSEGPRPDLDGYLANADNLGFSFVFFAHWIANGATGDFPALRDASRVVQRVIRLLNDLGTYERDLKWGDLNALLLPGTDKTAVEERIEELMAEARRLLAPLPPEHGGYMRRQMEFCSGFYGITDYWGAEL
ncbi:hypothetical protein GCM10022221_02310 [Actinocorallia aurea]